MINYIQLKEGHYDYVVEWDMLNGIKKINNHETVTKLDDKGNTIKLLGSVKMDCNWKFNWNNKDAISGYLNNAEVEGIANTVLWPMNSASYSDVEPEARIKGYIVDINQQTPAQQTKIIKKYSWEIKEINGQDISFIEVSNPEEIIESKSLGCKIKTAKDKTTPILKDGQLYQEYNINVKCHITAYDDSTQDVDCGTFSLYVYDNQVFANENVSGLAFGWKDNVGADNKVALGYANFDKEISNLQFKTDFTVNFLGTEYTNCNVVKICNGAFNSCNNILKSIVIPKTVTEIEAGAFNNLQNVDCIEFESEIPPKFGVDEETNLFWVNNMSQKFHIIVPGPEAVTAYRDADGINLHNSLIMDGLVTPKTVDIDADNFIEGKTDSDGFYQLEAITHPDGMVKTGTWFVSCMDLGDKISCDSNTGKLSWQAGISPGQYRLDIIYLWNKNAIITATKTITLQINDISPIVNDSNLALGLGLGLGIGVPGVMAAVGVPIIVNKKKQKTEEELSELK